MSTAIPFLAMRSLTCTKRRSLPPAIPEENTFPPVDGFFLLEVKGPCTVFEDRDRAIVGHFRRSSKIDLEGQVKLDV